MPIEAGHYCQHCVDADGKLGSYESRVEGMAAFMMGRDPSLTREAAIQKTKEYMSTMPAWKNHKA
jgi:hypothetical protein